MPQDKLKPKRRQNDIMRDKIRQDKARQDETRNDKTITCETKEENHTTKQSEPRHGKTRY